MRLGANPEPTDLEPRALPLRYREYPEELLLYEFYAESGLSLYTTSR